MNMCKDRIAIITGAAGSIGRSTALTLAREGAKVIVNYRTSEAMANSIVQHIRSGGGAAMAVQADVTQQADVQRLVAAAENTFGRIDILVNNAGGGWAIRDYTKMEPDQWRSVLSGEIDSTLLLLKYVVPGMRERKWGRIVHLGMDRVTRFLNMKDVAPDYCLGKAARSWMTTALGVQEIKHGITVNCIGPGITPALASLEQAVEYAAPDSGWSNHPELCPQDIAEGIAFLCSEAGRCITGSELTYEDRS